MDIGAILVGLLKGYLKRSSPPPVDSNGEFTF